MTPRPAERAEVLSPRDAEHQSAAEPVARLGWLLAAGADSTEAFYGVLCRAACETAKLTRAVAFVDAGDGRLTIAGVWGVHPPVPVGSEVATGPDCPVVRALRGDAVLEGAWPECCALLTRAFGRSRLVVVPMVSGGRALGAVVADRGGAPLCLSPHERRALSILGKTAAVAAAARMAADRGTRERRVAERVELGRRLHDGVAQRLFGLSAVLEGAQELDRADRARLATELEAARQELAAAVEDALPPPPERLHPVPEPAATEDTAALCAIVLREALRNVGKHTRATRIAVRLEAEGGDLRLEIRNDGRPARAPRAGLGLRLASLEAARRGAALEWGPDGAEDWTVRLRTGGHGRDV